MGLYLRAKFEVSSIILTGFRWGAVNSPPQNEPLKSPPRLGLKLVIISEYQNIGIFLQKVTYQIGHKFLWLKKLKNMVLRYTYIINDLNGEEIVGTFYENELQKTNQKEFRIVNVIKREGDKLYVKWKGHNNSFNSWIDKNDIL